jgi:hypothetical protein
MTIGKGKRPSAQRNEVGCFLYHKFSRLQHYFLAALFPIKG